MNFTMPIKDMQKVEELKEVLSKNPRDLLLFMLAICTGIRCSDCLSIHVKDVRDTKYIKLRESKTKKSKRVIINEALRAVLDPYIEKMDNDDFLFQSREGHNQPLSRSQAHRIITQAASKVGLSEIGFHGLRKTLAFRVFEESSYNIGLVMVLLNHSSEKTSLAYLGLGQETIDSAISKLRF
jgi:integrase